MNERQHIALTEAQIIAAEKGELQLEYRNGEKVCFLFWRKGKGQEFPIETTCNNAIKKIHDVRGINIRNHDYDLFVSDPAEQEQVSPKQAFKDITKEILKVGEIGLFEGVEYLACAETVDGVCSGCDLYNECITCFVKCCDTILKRVDTSTEQSPKPLYEVGEIIEHDTPSGWIDVEYREDRNGQVCVWSNGVYKSIRSNNVRKKQKPRIYISGRITGIDYKEAFALFEAAENELITKGYEVVNPMKVVPYNKDWSWFDYLSADIKLMEKCTHIYMLSNWRESGGASVEHEAAKWNNFTIIYQ